MLSDIIVNEPSGNFLEAPNIVPLHNVALAHRDWVEDLQTPRSPLRQMAPITRLCFCTPRLNASPP
jgi:hypothetical protein